MSVFVCYVHLCECLVFRCRVHRSSSPLYHCALLYCVVHLYTNTRHFIVIIIDEVVHDMRFLYVVEIIVADIFDVVIHYKVIPISPFAPLFFPC